MHHPLRLLSGLLPVCGLSLLAVGGPVLPRLLPPPAAAQTNPPWPASLNKTRRILLIQQYRFYLHNRCHHDLGRQAAALYNQCIADSDPSVVGGTRLPRRLPE